MACTKILLILLIALCDSNLYSQSYGRTFNFWFEGRRYIEEQTKFQSETEVRQWAVSVFGQLYPKSVHHCFKSPKLTDKTFKMTLDQVDYSKNPIYLLAKPVKDNKKSKKYRKNKYTHSEQQILQTMGETNADYWQKYKGKPIHIYSQNSPCVAKCSLSLRQIHDPPLEWFEKKTLSFGKFFESSADFKPRSNYVEEQERMKLDYYSAMKKAGYLVVYQGTETLMDAWYPNTWQSFLYHLLVGENVYLKGVKRSARRKQIADELNGYMEEIKSRDPEKWTKYFKNDRENGFFIAWSRCWGIMQSILKENDEVMMYDIGPPLTYQQLESNKRSNPLFVEALKIAKGEKNQSP